MSALSSRIPSPLSHLRLRRRPHSPLRLPPLSRSIPHRLNSAVAASRFGWHDVALAAEDRHDDDPADLRPYFDRVRACNRGSEMKGEFVPFMMEGQIVGCVHREFINHLWKFNDVFTFILGNNEGYDGGHITLHSSLETPEDRTRAVGDAIKCLGELIPAIPCDIFIWDAYILLSRACSGSLLRHKGIRCPYEWLCRKGRREISLDCKEK